MNVADATGGGLNGSLISVINLLSKQVYSVTTDAKGDACLKVPEGLYSVEAGRLGFLDVRYYPVQVDFPSGKQLRFQLPVGLVTEGGITNEVTLAGTLKNGDRPVMDARICLTLVKMRTPLKCTITNEMGEYALIVPTGVYRTEIWVRGSETEHSTLELTVPGSYHNLMTSHSAAAQTPK